MGRGSFHSKVAGPVGTWLCAKAAHSLVTLAVYPMVRTIESIYDGGLGGCTFFCAVGVHIVLAWRRPPRAGGCCVDGGLVGHHYTNPVPQYMAGEHAELLPIAGRNTQFGFWPGGQSSRERLEGRGRAAIWTFLLSGGGPATLLKNLGGDHTSVHVHSMGAQGRERCAVRCLALGRQQHRHWYTRVATLGRRRGTSCVGR